MEVFRFTVASSWQRINKRGFLGPRIRNDDYRPVYAIPESPRLWDPRELFEMIRWIETISREPVTILMKFDVPILNRGFKCYVQEGNIEPWFKRKTKKEARFYQREDYDCPEFVIHENIPVGNISLVEAKI